MRSLVLYLLFLSLAIGCTLSISVTTATRQVKSGNLLGAPVSVGVFEIEFDENISVTKTYGHCTNRTCAPTPVCEVCDYTDADVCAGSRATGPCPCPVGPICDIPNTLQLDVPFSIYLGPDEVQDFKVFLGAETCKFAYIRLETQSGDPDLYVASATDYNAQGFTSSISDRYGPETAILCPADMDYEMGTLAIEVYSFPSEFFALGIGANITLTVSLHDIPEPVVAPLSCTPTSADHICLTDDEMYFFSPSTADDGIRYFELDLPQQCTPISFFSSRGTTVFFSYVDEKPSTENDQPTVLFRGADASGGLQRDAFTLCPQDLGISKLYIAVTASLANSFISVSTNPGWVFYEPLTRYNPFQYVFETYGASMMTCPFQETVFVCFYRIFDDHDCELYWTVSPTEEAVPLFPRPSFTTGIADFNQMMMLDPPSNPLPNKFVSVVMLNYTLDLQTTVIATEDQLTDCSLTFLGRLVDNARQPLQFTVTYEDKDLGCDANKLQETVEEMRTLLDEQQAIQQGQMLSNIRYQLDMMALYDNTYGCREFVTELYTATTVETEISTANCLAAIDTEEFASDPCCNTSLSWTGPACFVRSVPYEVDSFVAVSSSAEQCYAPQCLESIIQDYFSSSSTASDIVIGCSSNTPGEFPYRTALFRPYGMCKDLAFGVFPEEGIPCGSDADCNGDKCDLLQRRCLTDVASQYDTFLDCFLTTTDPFIITTIELAKNIQPVSQVGQEANRQQWKTAFTTSDCTGTYDLALPYRAHWSLEPGFESTVCPACENFQCLDRRCTVPTACDNYIDSNCFKVWTEVPSTESACNAVESCNWFDCDTLEFRENCSAVCLNGTTSFCGLTENGQDYAEIENVPDSGACTGAIGCILHDQTVTAEATEADCTSQERCSVLCWTGDTSRLCVDSNECTSSGNCLGGGEFLAPGGSCVLPAPPFLSPTCPYNLYDGLPSIATNIGCIDTSVTQESDCVNGTWMLPARTAAECAAFGNGCLETFFDESFINGFIVTLKDEQSCIAVGGTYGPLLTWVPGTWQGGVVRTLEWVPRALYNPYALAETLDFPTLYEEIRVAIDTKYAFELKTQSKCFYGQQLDLLNVVSCSCNPSGSASEECFATYDPTSSDAVNVICQGITGTLEAGNVLAYYGSTTLDSTSTCITVGLGSLSIGEFRFTTKDALSSFLFDFSLDTEFSFTNDLSAIVGRLIGDGVSFRFSDATLNDVNICVSIKNPGDFGLQNYPIFDIATVDIGTNEVKPLGISMNVTDYLFCGKIPTIRPDENVAYFPVVRVDKWETETPSLPLTSAELALLIICIICYAFCAVFSLVKAGIIMHAKLYKQLNLIVLLLLAALCIVRLLFYLLSVGGVFATQNARGVYILIELPSFLYFSALSFFVVLWIFTMRLIRQPSISRRVMNKRIIRVVAIFNGTLYAIFILLIILYESLPQSDTVICGGRFTIRDVVTRQTIALVYRLIVSILSLALGAGYLINGFRVYHGMVQSTKKSGRTSDKDGTKRRIFWTATICSIGLLLQCAFLLALLFSGYRNNVVAMAVLLAVEVMPIATVVGILRTIDAKQKFSKSTTNSITRRSMHFNTSTSNSKDTPNSGDATSNADFEEVPMHGAITTEATSNMKPITPQSSARAEPEAYPESESSSSSEESSSSSIASSYGVGSARKISSALSPLAAAVTQGNGDVNNNTAVVREESSSARPSTSRERSSSQSDSQEESSSQSSSTEESSSQSSSSSNNNNSSS